MEQKVRFVRSMGPNNRSMRNLFIGKGTELLWFGTESCPISVHDEINFRCPDPALRSVPRDTISFPY